MKPFSRHRSQVHNIHVRSAVVQWDCIPVKRVSCKLFMFASLVTFDRVKLVTGFPMITSTAALQYRQDAHQSSMYIIRRTGTPQQPYSEFYLEFYLEYYTVFILQCVYSFGFYGDHCDNCPIE